MWRNPKDNGRKARPWFQGAKKWSTTYNAKKKQRGNH